MLVACSCDFEHSTGFRLTTTRAPSDICSAGQQYARLTQRPASAVPSRAPKAPPLARLQRRGICIAASCLSWQLLAGGPCQVLRFATGFQYALPLTCDQMCKQ